MQLLQGIGQKAMHRLPGWLDPLRANIDHLEKVIDVAQNRGSAAPEEKLRSPRISCPVLTASVPRALLFHAESPPLDLKHRKMSSSWDNCRKRKQNWLEPPSLSSGHVFLTWKADEQTTI